MQGVDYDDSTSVFTVYNNNRKSLIVLEQGECGPFPSWLHARACASESINERRNHRHMHAAVIVVVVVAVESSSPRNNNNARQAADFFG